jgi:hypothetical protein
VYAVDLDGGNRDWAVPQIIRRNMEVIEFKREGSVDECLEVAKAENLESILIIGLTKDNDVFFNYDFDKIGEAYWCLNVVRKAIEEEFMDAFE